MVGLWTRSPRPRKPVAPRSVRLFLERLEDRLSPTSMLGPTPPPPPGPETLTMNVTYDPNKQVTLTGGLSNGSGPVANQTIYFNGAVQGTATTNAQGTYTVTLPAKSLGQVTAVSSDGLSNRATFNLASQTPTINNFDAVSLGNGYWKLTGTVSGAPYQGEVVDFGTLAAVDGQHANVNQDGSFSFYCYIPSGEGGTVSAVAVDWWGDTSDVSGAFVNC